MKIVGLLLSLALVTQTTIAILLQYAHASTGVASAVKVIDINIK